MRSPLQVFLGIDDWIAEAGQNFDADVLARAPLSTLISLAATAERLDAVDEILMAPSPAQLQELAASDASVQQISPQWAYVESQSPYAQWMWVADVAEQVGQGRLAQFIVDAVRRVLEVQRQNDDAARGDEFNELIAICWSRRGRIARIAGHHDDAQECYLQAAQLVRSAEWRDARPMAELGQCALSVVLGNYPAVGRRASALLSHSPSIAAVHRVAAHQFLAMARRKSGQLLDAMLHSWHAYDLTPEDDVRRPELILTISETAAELGDDAAAEHGFVRVLDVSQVTRLRISALVGAVACRLRAALRAPTDSADLRLRSYQTELVTQCATSLAPRDEVRARLALAEIELSKHRLREASAHAARAATVADEHGLFEHQFRVDDLNSRIERASQPTRHGSTTTTTAVIADEQPADKRARRHAALARLMHPVFATSGAGR